MAKIKINFKEGLPSKTLPNKYVKIMEQQASNESSKLFGQRIKIDFDSYILGTQVGQDTGFDIEKRLLRVYGAKGGKRETRLLGIVAVAKKYKAQTGRPTFGKFWNFISHKQYTKNTPYKIDGYSLYAEGDKLYHIDETKMDKKGKAILKSKPIAKRTVERYFNVYSR